MSNNKIILIDYQKENIIKVDEYKIRYKGLVFYENKKQGKDTIKDFFSKYKTTWLKKIYELSGNFLLDVEDIDNNERIIVTDNSGMYRIYYDKKNITDDYLNYLDITNKTIKDIDAFGIVELLQFGYNIFHTSIKGTKILKRNEIITVKDSKISITKKQNIELFSTGNNIVEFYKNFKNNFSGMKVACDLTAGIDSRLNAVLLKRSGIDFSTTIMGNKDHIDVIKNRIISDELKVTSTNYVMDENVDENTLISIFEDLDGQYSILEYYKNYLLKNKLIKDKFNLRISGAGGEMYKYSMFAQDFPFFNRKKFSLDQVYMNRFYNPSLNNTLLTNETIENINIYQKKFKKNLEGYKCITNSKTYDNLCYELIMRYGASTYMISKNKNYNRYCPLLELKIVRNGINLKVYERLLCMLHRRIITQYSTKIAKEKTNCNLTVHNGIFFIICDCGKLFIQCVQRLFRKVFRIYKRDIDAANSKEIYNIMRKKDSKYEKILKKNNIIKKNIKLNEFNDSIYSRLITIAMIYNKLEK